MGYLKKMNRSEFLQLIHTRKWIFRPAISGKEFYGLVKGQHQGKAFYFFGQAPCLPYEEYDAFWQDILNHLAGL